MMVSARCTAESYQGPKLSTRLLRLPVRCFSFGIGAGPGHHEHRSGQRRSPMRHLSAVGGQAAVVLLWKTLVLTTVQPGRELADASGSDD
jgi:hypothetical protein